MTLKGIQIIVFTLLTSLLFGQSVDMLQLKNQKYFSEKNLFTSDTVTKLGLQIYYDIPEMDDAENIQEMFFTIKDKSSIISGTQFDLEKDSVRIKPFYALRGAWRYEGAKSYSGYIKVISITEKEITLYLDFTVNGQKKYIYKGERTFTKTKQFPIF